jgi:hypothetical protein
MSKTLFASAIVIMLTVLILNSAKSFVWEDKHLDIRTSKNAPKLNYYLAGVFKIINLTSLICS